jgi:hypothetical protein
LATFKIYDRTDEFRVELIGLFAGACVHELRSTWQNALRNTHSPQFTVDLAHISGCDADGRKLLKEMHQHGAQFAAGTPEALVFLREISTPVRRGPALVQAVRPARLDNTNKPAPKVFSKAAGG